MSNNTQLIKKLFQECYTKGKNPKLWEELFSKDVLFLDSSEDKPLKGLNLLLDRENYYLSAFPDKVAKINEILESGDKVIVHWTVDGTHSGELQGLPATGRHFHISGISIFTLSNGKIREVRQVWDRLGLLEQLGKAQNLAALS